MILQGIGRFGSIANTLDGWIFDLIPIIQKLFKMKWLYLSKIWPIDPKISYFQKYEKVITLLIYLVIYVTYNFDAQLIKIKVNKVALNKINHGCAERE